MIVDAIEVMSAHDQLISLRSEVTWPLVPVYMEAQKFKTLMKIEGA
jgi:hypothetical protein